MTKGQKNVLFLRNWIRSGIRKVWDLIFTDGILDENCIYQRLIGKQNVYSEIMIVMEALRPYQQNLIEMQTIEMHRRALRKSRDFYQIYLQQLLDSIGEPSKDYLKRYNITSNDDIYRQVFTNKVKIEKEIKLKEFNFKLLHGILPCNKNLEKWKIRANDKCDVCGSSQTIDHLLYNCNYVRPLWRLVERKFGIIISFEQILGLDPLFEYDSITSIISFLIYKEWLLLSLENKTKKCWSKYDVLQKWIAVKDRNLQVVQTHWSKSCRQLDGINIIYVNLFAVLSTCIDLYALLLKCMGIGICDFVYYMCVWINVCNSLRKNVWMQASEWMICEHTVVSFAFMYVCKRQLWK